MTDLAARALAAVRAVPHNDGCDAACEESGVCDCWELRDERIAKGLAAAIEAQGYVIEWLDESGNAALAAFESQARTE